MRLTCKHETKTRIKKRAETRSLIPEINKRTVYAKMWKMKRMRKLLTERKGKGGRLNAWLKGEPVPEEGRTSICRRNLWTTRG